MNAIISITSGTALNSFSTRGHWPAAADEAMILMIEQCGKERAHGGRMWMAGNAGPGRIAMTVGRPAIGN